MQEAKEVTRMDSGPFNLVSATRLGGSGTELLVYQDRGRVQGDDELQGRLCLLDAVPNNPPEEPSCTKIQRLAAPASPAMSLVGCGSIPEVYAGVEQEWEICHNGVPDPRLTSPDNVHMITVDGDDTGKSDQQLCIWTREAAVERPSYPTPANSSSGVRSDLCEQFVESGRSRSPGPISLSPNPVPVAAAATGLEWLPSTHVADGALSEVMLDEPSHVVGVAGTVGPHNHRARSERAGSIDYKCTPHSAWTSGQDEQLLHLHDTAQLNWRNIVNYFPKMTLDAIKCRYKHLSGSGMACQTIGDLPKPRSRRYMRNIHHASSTPQKSAKTCRPPSGTATRKQPIGIFSEHRSTPSCRHAIQRAKPTKYGALLANATTEDASLRTSRCGRPIRHPFRHRLSEGYL